MRNRDGNVEGHDAGSDGGCGGDLCAGMRSEAVANRAGSCGAGGVGELREEEDRLVRRGRGCVLFFLGSPMFFPRATEAGRWLGMTISFGSFLL